MTDGTARVLHMVAAGHLTLLLWIRPITHDWYYQGQS